MEEEDIVLVNACADLLSLKKTEAFPMHLLGNKRSGEWVGVGEFCRQIGLAQDKLKPDVYATWLPDPANIEGYVVVMFFDTESGWSMCAQYNRQRLLGKPIAQASSVKEISELITGVELMR